MTRAKGCYQKALTINPSHPVAGRGIVRLISLEGVQILCENAAKCNSLTNGWAWRALGQLKSRSVNGDITAASICFQQALRCRDIHSPENETLGIFFAEPTLSQVKASSEASNIWVELAACYRQLGKYSAALRAFDGALASSGGNLSPDALCAWAQIDLDLGLYTDAAEKCSRVLSMEDSALHYYHRMAAYIEGKSCLFLAKSCIQEGKFGSSLSHLEKGIARLSSLSIHETSSMNHYCEIKLLGDLYSLGNSLPSYAFETISPDGENTEKVGNFSNNGTQNQLSFLMKGEQAYTLAMDIIKREDEIECTDTALVAAAAIDLATNLLSQTRLVLLANSEDANKSGNQINHLIARSVNAYVLAIDVCPHDPSAWCGLGCALIAVDPIMSQHAFSRALQIDPSFASSWSNISLMYANKNTQKCSEILDHLAEVDDTPLMWIGRGFLFEINASGEDWTDENGGTSSRAGCFTKAADAYRAALQIMQHPAALLGLSMTCRRATSETNDLVYNDLVEKVTKFESMTSLVIHQSLIGEDNNAGASLLNCLTQIEKELNLLTTSDNLNSAVLITEAKQTVYNFMSRSNKVQVNTIENEVFNLCEMDLSVNSVRELCMEKREEFPYDMIKTALDCDVSVSSKRLYMNDNCQGNLDSGIDKAQFSVLLNPDSGEAWLIFAHQLAKEVTNGNNSISLLTSAKIAAKRSYDLLYERVVNATMLTPRRQELNNQEGDEYSDMSALSNLPPATLLSESMSLLAWFDGIELYEEMGNKRSYAILQEALMLDPSNCIAVTALGLSPN
jgi:superkiller protein 3